jgi:hypothetical protein
VLSIPDSAYALIVQEERDRKVKSDPAIRTLVFASGGVTAARASSNPEIRAAADAYYHACRRDAALRTAQGVQKPRRRSQAQRKAHTEQRVQQARAAIAAAQAADEDAAAAQRLREGSRPAHDPTSEKTPAAKQENSKGYPRSTKQPPVADTQPIGVPAGLAPVAPPGSAKKHILSRLTSTQSK